MKLINFLSGKTLGQLRRLLMIRGTYKWNAWVRDLTAYFG